MANLTTCQDKHIVPKNRGIVDLCVRVFLAPFQMLLQSHRSNAFPRHVFAIRQYRHRQYCPVHLELCVFAAAKNVHVAAVKGPHVFFTVYRPLTQAIVPVSIESNTIYMHVA